MKPAAEEVDEDCFEDEKTPSSGHSGHDTSNDAKEGEESSESFNLGRRETTMLKYSKLLVVAIILVVTVIMGFLTYSLVKQQQTDEYHAAVSNRGRMKQQLCIRQYPHFASLLCTVVLRNCCRD
jgi:hypothetical protein